MNDVLFLLLFVVVLTGFLVLLLSEAGDDD